ncbi:MAG: hypothetical protein ABL996_07780 [Micropepsaceae bacterium]
MPDFKELARRRLAAEEKAAPGSGGDAATLPEEERHYRAFRGATRALIALSVRLLSGDRLHYPYGHYSGGIFWASGEYVQLDFGTLGLLHLWGARLVELEELLGEGNIRVLEEFDPARWGEPPQGEPVITRIEFQRVGEKTPEELEVPPPPDEQH